MDKAKYETLAESCRRAMANSSSADESTISPGEVFGSFDDVLKYSGAAPTEPYLRHVWRIWFADLSVKSPNISWTQEDYQYRVLRLWDGPPSASAAHHGGTPKQAYVRTGERDDLRMPPPATESDVSGEKRDTHPHPHLHTSGEENVAMDAGAGAGAGTNTSESAGNVTSSAGAAEQCASRPRWLPNVRECRPVPAGLGFDGAAAALRPRASSASTSTQVTQGETRQEDDTQP